MTRKAGTNEPDRAHQDWPGTFAVTTGTSGPGWPGTSARSVGSAGLDEADMMAGTDTAALSRSPREVVPSRSRPSVVLPATALLFGIAGTAAGAGVCSAHLAKAGLDAAAVLAAVALAAGVVLLVWGTAMLVRAIPGWWRLLAVPTALMLLWFVLLPLTVAVNATSRPPGPLGPATPAGYGLGYQDVAFRTADGVRLSAWYIPPRNGAAVALLPGAGSTRTSLLGQAAVLARHGYGALLVDTRGHGRSGGALQRGMEWVMYTTAGLISGAPRPMSIPDAIRADGGRPTLIIAGGDGCRRIRCRPLVPGRLARYRAGVGGAARRAHPGPGRRAPGLGSSRDRLPGRRSEIRIGTPDAGM